jgi:hypothetical protein
MPWADFVASMSAALRIQDYVGEPPKIDMGTHLSSSAAILADIEKGVRKQRAIFETLYEAAKALSPDEIRDGCADLLKTEREHATTLAPLIQDAERRIDTMLRSKLSHTAAEKSYMRQYDKFADALASWLEALRDIRIRLQLLASDKMHESGAPDIEITEDDDLDRYFRSITGQ